MRISNQKSIKGDSKSLTRYTAQISGYVNDMEDVINWKMFVFCTDLKIDWIWYLQINVLWILKPGNS